MAFRQYAYCIFIALFGFASIGQSLNCSRKPHSVPDPTRKPGTSDPKNPIEHIIVVMQENHSFDSYFGALNQPQFYGPEIDGTNKVMSNPDKNGSKHFIYHEKSLCPDDPNHDWNTMHISWSNGTNQGFLINNGPYCHGDL
jgi:phospholipase C